MASSEWSTVASDGYSLPAGGGDGDGRRRGVDVTAVVPGVENLVEVARRVRHRVPGRQIQFDRDVAVKVITVKGIEQDTRALHPRVPSSRAPRRAPEHRHRVRRRIHRGPRPYMVMSYLPNGSLADRLGA